MKKDSLNCFSSTIGLDATVKSYYPSNHNLPPFVCNRSLDSIVNFPYTYCKISLHFYNYLILATFSKPIF